MAEATPDDTLDHAKQWRIVKWGAVAAVAAAVSVWFATTAVPDYIKGAHAQQHLASNNQLEQITAIAKQNAEYINNQILAQLYLRAGRLREDVEENPNDSGARDALARTEVEIRRREAQLAADADSSD